MNTAYYFPHCRIFISCCAWGLLKVSLQVRCRHRPPPFPWDDGGRCLRAQACYGQVCPHQSAQGKGRMRAGLPLPPLPAEPRARYRACYWPSLPPLALLLLLLLPSGPRMHSRRSARCRRRALLLAEPFPPVPLFPLPPSFSQVSPTREMRMLSPSSSYLAKALLPPPPPLPSFP